MAVPRYRITINWVHDEGHIDIVRRTVPSSDVDASRVTGGGAASVGVTGGGAASGGVTCGGAASWGATGDPKRAGGQCRANPTSAMGDLPPAPIKPAFPSASLTSRQPRLNCACLCPLTEGLTLVRISAQRKRFVWDKGCIGGI